MAVIGVESAVKEEWAEIFMKVYIDADGCHVVRNTLKIAGKFNVSCVIICDTSHQIEHENAETIVVDKGADSVDFV